VEFYPSLAFLIIFPSASPENEISLIRPYYTRQSVFGKRTHLPLSDILFIPVSVTAEHCERVIEINPEYAKARINYAVFLEKLGKKT